MLLAAGATVVAYDPAAMERAQAELPPSARMLYAANAYQAADDADALLILTDWKEFAQLDLVELYQALRFPIVIDGRNLYPPSQMEQSGFTYVSMGRPATYQAQHGLQHKKLA
jgi:UDPglucose 6-dehydrogenase